MVEFQEAFFTLHDCYQDAALNQGFEAATFGFTLNKLAANELEGLPNARSQLHDTRVVMLPTSLAICFHA